MSAAKSSLVLNNNFLNSRRFFPEPEITFEDGLVAFSDEINSRILLEAYSFGIFPWPHEDMPLLWFCPDPRGILEFKDLHLSRSFEKLLKKTEWTITFDQKFAQVIDECAKMPRAGQGGTWITPQIKRAYQQFHEDGYAHSIECWEGDQLIGGLYGVGVGGVFSGESMFYKKANASKFCLYHLICKLKSIGFQWLDIQMVTPVTQAWGGKYISRKLFLEKVREVHKGNREGQVQEDPTLTQS